jgi:hypothetical protein
MAPEADTRLLVLHAVKLKGFADDPVVAAHVGLGPTEARAALEKLAADGLAVRRDGRLSGWSLTADGRAAHAALIREEIDGAGCRAPLDAAYRSFLGLNGEMLALCTDWQLRADGGTEQVPNDHSDAAYDAGVIARLGTIDDSVQPVCRELEGCLPRFAGYADRLANARARVEAGEQEWFTKPLIDSYHTVWFELHEDLLVTLGIDRGAEVPAGE